MSEEEPSWEQVRDSAMPVLRALVDFLELNELNSRNSKCRTIPNALEAVGSDPTLLQVDLAPSGAFDRSRRSVILGAPPKGDEFARPISIPEEFWDRVDEVGQVALIRYAIQSNITVLEGKEANPDEEPSSGRIAEIASLQSVLDAIQADARRALELIHVPTYPDLLA